ncbi:uncharacterized protein LOC117167696 [Belonocnema kinseyi]|uniref:uncharacterized protein LOC117167696 n=1 Tax=Belonocnema kinseyi TaxID=2817044 RepID=UPI00143D2D32|nr:uncharacterized protein LOC117167696 [Belonocnema kinseyi]
MSAESQESPRVAKPESIFDGTRIKKERNDVCADGPIVDDGNVAGDGAVRSKMEPQRAPATPICITPRVSNGFHNEDLLRDVLVGKFATLAHHTPAAKHEKIRLMIEESIGDESRSRVHEIFSQVEKLKIEEKLMLYLKLPLSLSNPSGMVDPLRQPLNPLGNRYEIHQTIMWIRTHLEEDPDVSLPKQEVYDEYNMFCVRNSMKPLSTADFGKVMKQVYPRVRPRRLGTRGNSRYCYAGMRKKIKLDHPKLPVITGLQADESAEENITEDMLGAASKVIREWAESLLLIKFPTLSALGRYLVENLCVDTESLAAMCIVCGTDSPENEKKETSESPIAGKPVKLREAQLQLQRKLQQREQIRDQKQRHLENESPSQNKEKTVNNSKGCKGSKKKTNQSPQGTNCQLASVKGGSSSTTPVPRQRKAVRSSSQSCLPLQSNCDNNLLVQSIESAQRSGDAAGSSSLPKEAVKSTTRNPRKRTSGGVVASQSQDNSPEKQAKLEADANPADRSCTPVEPSGNISVILASNHKNCSETADSQSRESCDIDLTRCAKSGQAKLNGRSSLSAKNNHHPLLNEQIPLLENSNFLQRSGGGGGNLGTIDPDSLDDYLNGGNNSQEQEEELLQYFQQGSCSSSSDFEAGGNNNVTGDADLSSRSDKVSQLRLILQQNLKASSAITHPANPTTPVSVPPLEKQEIISEKLILPTINHTSHQTSIRRRVSFETSVVEHIQDSASVAHTVVPQSPNTRRRIFNFTPISPGPHSPINGRASKSNSANASPFVSPRNTPVPRSRSNLQSGGCRSRGAKKTLSRSISCSVPYTTSKNNETFVVPTSGPETLRQVSSVSRSPLVVTKTVPKRGGGGGQKCPAAFLPDLDPQKQLIINYPSQENLQEVKNVYRKTQQTDQEISDLLHGEKELKFVDVVPSAKEQFYCRSQSVPLHRMVNPTLMSPISIQNFLTPFRSFNPSTSSSIAPTPVPSEFNDFGSIDAADNAIYLLEDVDAASFMSDEQPFLMADKEMTSENISNFLNILDEGGEILPGNSVVGQSVIETSTMMLAALPDADLNLTDDGASLDHPGIGGLEAGSSLEKMIQSRSYPNTPLPLPSSSSSYALPYTEDSNGSRSHPSTPLNIGQPRDTYAESNEPMLSSPTLETLNLRGDVTTTATTTTTTTNSSESVCRSVEDFLDSTFLDHVDGDADDLDPLGSFEGLQDVDSLAPLFTEVVEPNR